jgi:dTDP-4-amino-4,6-dideoxygalactose transaminase
VDIGRNYGAGQDYDCQFIGLNGKMSEFHAAIALESLSLIDKFVSRRNELAVLYRKRLSEIPGISFQYINKGDLSTFKDFAMIIDREKFGMDRDKLISMLNQEGIFPKKYFSPIHLMKAYEKVPHKAESLTHTECVAGNIICLPIYSHMANDALERICYTVFRIWRSANIK